MTKEYKFRGKRKDNGVWVYGLYVEHEDIAYIVIENTDLIEPTGLCCEDCEDIGLVGLVEVIPETVGQWTGREDKNGKEIYDGDALSVIGWNDMQIVIWDEQVLQWQINNECPLNMISDSSGNYAIVIGNIHDNPELKGGE